MHVHAWLRVCMPAPHQQPIPTAGASSMHARSRPHLSKAGKGGRLLFMVVVLLMRPPLVLRRRRGAGGLGHGEEPLLSHPQAVPPPSG